jgi:hypothetical protein
MSPVVGEEVLLTSDSPILETRSFLLYPALHHIPRSNSLAHKISMRKLHTLWKPRRPRTINQHYDPLLQHLAILYSLPLQPISLIN